MGGFLRMLVLAALGAGAVVWLRRGGIAQFDPHTERADAQREHDQRQLRELSEAVEQLRGELTSTQEAWQREGQADERVDALWSERERSRELESRIVALEQARAADAARAVAQAAQLEQVSAALDALRDDVAVVHSQWQAADLDREDRIDAVRRERARAYELEQRLVQADGVRPTETSWWDQDPPASFAELVEQVRSSLPLVALPQSALEAIEELDQSESAASWAAETWRGLGALAEYASLTAQADSSGTGLPVEWNFPRWCADGGHPQAWPSDQIGIDAQRRVFPIDREVNWSGQVVVRTHLLVGDAADPGSPIFFVHDDTRGRTGRVHVVFLGPQRQAAAMPAI